MSVASVVIAASRVRRAALHATLACLLVPGAALAAPFVVKAVDVHFPQPVLYPGQDLNLTYTVAGPGANAPGGLTNVKVELVKSGSVVKTFTYSAGAAGAMSGVNNVVIPSAELPEGGPYTVRVTPTAAPVSSSEYIRVSNPDDPNMQFKGPRGLDVNRVSGHPALGRIYVTEGTGGVTKDRVVKDGVYVLNPDLTPTFPTARATSEDIGPLGPWTSSTHSPFRVYVAPTGNVYITDASDAHPAVIRANPDVDTFEPLFDPTGLTKTNLGLVSDAQGNEVFGDPTSVWMEGTGANRKYYLAIQELTPNSSIWEYSVPEGPPPPPQPTLAVGTGLAFNSWYTDFVRDAQGNFYVTNWQDAVSTANKYDASGLWVASLPAADPATTYFGIAIDDARNTILLATKDGRILKTTKSFDTVTPIITGMGAEVRDVAMDADGWVYAANLTDGALHVYAPPGNYPISVTAGVASTDLTVAGSPLAGDIWPVGPTGLYLGQNGQRYGDGKVDINDAVYNLRVAAGLNPLP